MNPHQGSLAKQTGFKNDGPKVPNQAEAKRDGVNLHNYNFNQF